MTSDSQFGWRDSLRQLPWPYQLPGVGFSPHLPMNKATSSLPPANTLNTQLPQAEVGPGLYTLDATGNILSVNLAGASQLGYTPEELIMTSMIEQLHPSDRATLEAHLEALQTPGDRSANLPSPPQSWKCRQRCKEGHFIEVTVSTQWMVGIAQSPSNRASTTQLLLTCEINRDRIAAPAVWQPESGLSAAILATTNSLIVVLDPQGQIVYFNAACEGITGYSLSEVQGLPFWDILLIPEEVIPVQIAFRDLKAGQFPNQYENYWVTKDQQHRLISWSNTAIVNSEGTVDYIIGTGIDITEQRQAEIALERSQQRQYQQLVDSIDGIVWIADATTWRFSLVSQKAEHILGYPVSAWLTEPHFWFNHLHPEDQAWVWAYCHQEVQAGHDHNLEFRMIAQDGRTIWLRNIVTVISDSQPPQLHGMMIDITERRQTELALQVSEARYRAVLEQAVEGIFLVDVGTKRLLESNAACRKLLGYDAEELLQLTLYDIIAHDRDSIDHNVQCILKQKQYSLGERQYRRRDGSLLTFEVQASLLKDGDRDILCVVVYNVTAYKETAAALQRSLSLLQATIESTADGIVAVSIEKELLANQKFVGMWQLPDKVLNSSIFEERIGFIASQTIDPPAFLQRILEIYQQPDLEVLDRVYLKDGRIFERYTQPQYLHDEIVGRVWSFRDITQQVTAEVALAQSEAKWRSLIQNSSDLIAILELDGMMRYQSPSSITILGYAPEELIGQNVFALIHPDDLAEVMQVFQDLSRCPFASLSVEFRFQHKNKTWRFLESTGTNLLTEPSVMGIVVNSRDITERKQAEQALHQQNECERLMRLIAQRIHRSLELEEILNTTVAEVRQFLQADRAIIFRLSASGSGQVSVESTATGCQSLLGRVMYDPCLQDIYQSPIATQRIKAIEDIETAGLPPCYASFLQSLQVKASLVMPILQGDTLWGLLIVHHCDRPRHWHTLELNFLEELVTQVAIAIQQSEFYQQVQHLNAQLEFQVAERTAQLQQALNFEATLKQITDKVRDSLDESQILQTAVRALAEVLGVACCDTALYDPDYTTSTISYEYTTSIPKSQGRVLRIADFPELYGQLLQGQYFQFCETVLNPFRAEVAMLACPIFDDQGVIGDLWLFRSWHEAFDEREIRLVQQVATQAAIAIRQARLYQAAQTQVQELEKLNQLKDDFLSTVSHELRTPVCNIKMAIQMLELSIGRDTLLSQPNSKTTRYLKVLRDECDREISLINDLLDLQRLDAGTQPLTLEVIHLCEWIQGVVQPFYGRAQNRQQQLEVEILQSFPPFLSNSASLARILAELLNNACKYTPPGERILVSATLQTESIQLQVSNCGVEIPAHELPHIFEKFYRVPSTDPWKQGGTGLGLALVQKLTELLGGKIEAHSAMGRTWFTLKFPLSPHQHRQEL